MRIAIVGTDYYPLRTSAAVQMADLAISLRSRGLEPIILVPSGKLAPLSAIHFHQDICIVELSSLPIKNVSYLARTIGEFLLPITMGLGLLFCKNISMKSFRGIICYSPSIFFGPLIYFLKIASKCRVYLIVRDIFPEWAFDLGLISNRAIYYFLKLSAHIQYCVSDVIGIQSPSNFRYVNYLGGDKVEVLHNWLGKSSNINCSINIQNTCLGEKKIFVYAGNMGIAQNLDPLIELAKKTSNLNHIGYLLIGRGSERNRLKSLCKQLELDNILFLEEIDASEVDSLLKQCHAGLISLDMRHQTHNIPGKFLSYRRAGLPVIANVDVKSDLSQMILSQKVGFVIPKFDFESCISAFQTLDDTRIYKDMQSNALLMVKNYFSVEVAVQSICKRLRINSNIPS